MQSEWSSNGGKRHPYPSYRDSGVEWLGEIPAHWEVVRIKHIAQFKYGDSLVNDLREAGDTPVYGSNGQVGTHSFSNTHAPCIIIGRKGSYGKVNYSSSASFAIDTTFYIDDMSTKCNIRWLYYGLSIIGLDAYSQDSAVPGLSRDFAHNLYLPKIPFAEQRAIADFLDRETARIDALIARYQRLMDLLEEKRASLISQAVTRGVDASVAMKDSGVEWLGEVPVHWEANRLKYVVKLPEEKLFQKPDGVIYLGLENIESWSGRLLLNAPIENVESSVNVFKSGDILFGKLRPYLAKVALPDFNGVSTTEILTLTPKKDLKSKFLFYVMLSEGFIRIIDSTTYGTKMPRANSQQIGNMIIPVPPLPEQCAIVDFLDRETARIDTAKEKIKTVIARTQEYRTALISAAVTGKMDVRAGGSHAV